jgi:hypothetical protein
MEIEIRFLGMEPSESLKDHALARAHAHFSRFGHDVRKLVVRINDVNGPKGGIDKRCVVTAMVLRFGAVSVTDISSNTYAAVDAALQRCAHALGGYLERGRKVRIQVWSGKIAS